MVLSCNVVQIDGGLVGTKCLGTSKCNRACDILEPQSLNVGPKLDPMRTIRLRSLVTHRRGSGLMLRNSGWSFAASIALMASSTESILRLLRGPWGNLPSLHSVLK